MGFGVEDSRRAGAGEEIISDRTAPVTAGEDSGGEASGPAMVGAGVSGALAGVGIGASASDGPIGAITGVQAGTHGGTTLTGTRRLMILMPMTPAMCTTTRRLTARTHPMIVNGLRVS